MFLYFSENPHENAIHMFFLLILLHQSVVDGMGLTSVQNQQIAWNSTKA